ncbi:MAG TPA: alpha/beta hydrolase [Candidatus Binatia bacterium]|nr:alpha/beta hydrolase [Candidatus Binatia bacterium]
MPDPSQPSFTRLSLRGAGGIKLVADAYGDPSHRPVILLHGGGQTRHAWRSTAAVLASAGFYAITMDHRGHGESDWDEAGDYELTTFAGDIRQVASTLSSPPALVGASLGGMAAMVCERDHPLASAVVLVDITPSMDPEGVQRILGFMRAFPDGFTSIDEAADCIASYLPHRPRPADTSGLAKNLRLGPDGRWRWHWDPRFLNDKPRSAHNEFPARMNAAARALAVPTLLVRGRMSEIVSEENVREFLELCPHAEYVDVEDAAHMVAGDRNDVFCSVVTEFLTRTVTVRNAAGGA